MRTWAGSIGARGVPVSTCEVAQPARASANSSRSSGRTIRMAKASFSNRPRHGGAGGSMEQLWAGGAEAGVDAAVGDDLVVDVVVFHQRNRRLQADPVIGQRRQQEQGCDPVHVELLQDDDQRDTVPDRPQPIPPLTPITWPLT